MEAIMSDMLRLYHWHVTAGGKTADYLCMAKDVDSARKAIIANIQIPGGFEFQQAGHDTFVASNPPSFVAEENYPIVIW
jgi:hypothetical protein